MDGGDTAEPVRRRLHGKQAAPECDVDRKKRGRSPTKSKGMSRKRHKAMKVQKMLKRPVCKKRAKAKKERQPKVTRKRKSLKRKPKYEVPDWRKRHWNPGLWKNNSHAREFEKVNDSVNILELIRFRDVARLAKESREF